MDSQTTSKQKNFQYQTIFAEITDSNPTKPKNKSARAAPRRLNTTKFLNQEIAFSDLN